MNKQSLLFLTPKSTYYNTKQDVIEEGLRLHEELLEKNRELYTCALFFNNATYYSKSIIIKNLLENSLNKPENNYILEKDIRRLELENKLIMYSLKNENITHALKTLIFLKDNKVNNSRVTKIVLSFIFDRNNTDYICIKYKNKIKNLIIHALGMSKVVAILENDIKGQKIFNKYIGIYNNPNAFEIMNFVFNKPFDYKNENFIEYIEVSNCFKNNETHKIKDTILPIEVLQGFNSFFKTNISLSTLFTKSNVSDKQKIQMQNSIKKDSNNKIEISLDLNKYSMLELFKYMYNKTEITKQEVENIKTILKEKASEIAKNLSLNKENTCIIVDCSHSHIGNSTSINHPLYMNLILCEVFNSFFELNDINHETFFTSYKTNELGLIIPNGYTCLYESLIEGVKGNYTNFIFLTDGFNNVGDFEEIYKALKRIENINAVQFNPVFSPKDMSCKEISPLIPTIPFKDEEDLNFLELSYLFNSNEEEFIKKVRKNILL